MAQPVPETPRVGGVSRSSSSDEKSLRESEIEPRPRRLSVGCGHLARPGWVNLDLAPLPGVDVVHNLDDVPLPFADDSFDYIECHDILEHVKDLPSVMRELHRISGKGGEVHITGPHFTSATWAADPTHRRAFTVNTFEFFTSNNLLDRDYYFDFAFSSVRLRRICFQRVWYQPWNYLVEPVINLHRKLQGFYESTFLSRLFPAHFIEIRLVR